MSPLICAIAITKQTLSIPARATPCFPVLEKNHDDTATVKALLHYAIAQNRCRVLVHPEWGTAVYPGILISEAPPSVLKWMIENIAPLHDWKLKELAADCAG